MDGPRTQARESLLRLPRIEGAQLLAVEPGDGISPCYDGVDESQGTLPTGEATPRRELMGEEGMTLLNLGPDDDLLHTGRLVPAGSDESTVYARSLRPGEKDSGEGVQVPAGKRLVIRAGDLSFSSDEIDERSPKGRGGYAPVADTIWTWYRMVGAEDQSLLMLLLAAARRLDATHVFWSATMDALEESGSLAGIERRSRLFQALAMAEVTVISLSRGVEMLYRLEQEFCLDLQIPEKIDSFREKLRRMRHALEHIDDRAMGAAKDDTADSAMSIFVQPHFVDEGVLTYAGEGVLFATGVPIALGHCRKAIVNVIDLRPRCEAIRPTSSAG